MSYIDPDGRDAVMILRTAFTIAAGICAVKTGYDAVTFGKEAADLAKEVNDVQQQINNINDTLKEMDDSKEQEKCDELTNQRSKLEQEKILLMKQRSANFSTLTNVIAEGLCAVIGSARGR